MCELTLQNAIKLSEPDEIKDNTVEEIIGGIIGRAATLGRSSICFAGQCDFTQKFYKNDDDMLYLGMPGLRMSYPYNTVQVYKENQWMFECFKLYKLLEIGTFPHSSEPGEYKYHNLPPILKIPRSDGTIHDAITRSEFYGIQVRKSVSDKTNPYVNIYVTLVFSTDEKTIENTDENIERISKLAGSVYKDITLEKLVEANPELAKQELALRYYAIPITDDMSEEQKVVTSYFNTYQKNWCDAYLKPSLQRFTDNGIMKCSYEIV